MTDEQQSGVCVRVVAVNKQTLFCLHVTCTRVLCSRQTYMYAPLLILGGRCRQQLGPGKTRISLIKLDIDSATYPA